jgi:hypothetical protein
MNELKEPSWHGGIYEFFLEGDDLDCCVIAEDDGGSSGVALAPGTTLKRLGGLLRPIFLIGTDPVLRGRWLSRLANAFWLDISLAPKTGPTTGALLLLRR